MKKRVIKILKDALKETGVSLSEKQIREHIELPPTLKMGDYSFPCYSVANKIKKKPEQLALEISKMIKESPKGDIENIQVVGAYINFFVKRKDFAKNILTDIIKKKVKFGSANLGHNQTVLVEFSSPNIAKPFGIGHLRSTIIGNSIANICAFQGFKTIKMNYLGDWGTQFGKMICGYKNFGKEEELKKDPIKYLLKIYVKINKDKKYEEESRAYFKKLEEGDKETLKLWKRFRELSLKEFEKIYNQLGIKFDIYSGESMYNQEMKKVVDELQQKKLLRKSRGALVVDLKKYNLGFCLIQKTDGTTLYATRDLASAITRHKKYKFSKMIYEVGQEQKLHFQQIFKVLELMKYPWAKECIHADHGLYLDKDGKKFSTRKGKTIFMEDILNDTISFAKKEISKRENKISQKELEFRALKIALSAIFYGDLKNTRTQNIIFNPKKFTSFEGDTGPYILYSYARANSILKKCNSKERKILPKELERLEFRLIKKLSFFPSSALEAYNNLSPAHIAHYAFELAQEFNEFYDQCHVIGSKEESFRLELVEAFIIVLKNSLNLLGLEPLERM